MRDSIPASAWKLCLLICLMLGVFAMEAEGQFCAVQVGGSSSGICSGASLRLVGIAGQCSSLSEKEKQSLACADVTFDEAIANANQDCGEGCHCDDLDISGPDLDCFQSTGTCYCQCSKVVVGSCTAGGGGIASASPELPSFLIPDPPALCTLAQGEVAPGEVLDKDRAL